MFMGEKETGRDLTVPGMHAVLFEDSPCSRTVVASYNLGKISSELFNSIYQGLQTFFIFCFSSSNLQKTLRNKTRSANDILVHRQD